jgi:hypothetical protein
MKPNQIESRRRNWKEGMKARTTHSQVVIAVIKDEFNVGRTKKAEKKGVGGSCVLSERSNGE